jgi:peptidoglycan hydrolase-like protein with peptidoglycan-binding domain
MSQIHNSEKFGEINVDTMSGVQTALSFLGHDPGEVDGFDGPNTRHALKEFQSEQGISADGIVGPNTRKTLLAALDKAAA